MNFTTHAPKDPATITAAACIGAGMSNKNLEAHFTGVDLNAAADLRVTRLSDVFAALGCAYRPGNDASMSKALNAAFSSAEIPAVLSNIAQKFALAGFGAVGEEWRLVSRAIPVKDFKAVKAVRLVMGGMLQPLAKNGELKHVSLSDEAREIAAATKGSIVDVTREDLVNDDLQVLTALPMRFGMMAGRTISTEVFGCLSHTASDYGANTSGAMSLAALTAAYTAAAGIRDAENNPLGALPNRVLCAPCNLPTAKAVYLSETVTGGTTERGGTNVMRQMLEPISSPYLGNGTAYWLFNSEFPLVDVAFLNGNTAPQIETAEANFNQLGISMRCYYDFAAAPGEVKAATYSTGA